VADLTREQQRLQAELGSRLSDIESRDSQITELRAAKLSDMKKHTEKIQEFQTRLQTQTKTLEDALAKSKAQSQILSSELSAAKEQATKDLDELRQKNQQLQKEKRKVRQTYTSEISALNTELTDLRKAVQLLKDENADLTSKQDGPTPQQLLNELVSLKIGLQGAEELESLYETAKRENEELKQRLAKC
jgi:DNA repair exonuclease SbcCD ATPase subunit